MHIIVIALTWQERCGRSWWNFKFWKIWRSRISGQQDRGGKIEDHCCFIPRDGSVTQKMRPWVGHPEKWDHANRVGHPEKWDHANRVGHPEKWDPYPPFCFSLQHLLYKVFYKTLVVSIVKRGHLLLPNFWLFIFYFLCLEKKYFKNRFLFKGEIERIEGLLVDWGLNRENREPKGQIRKSRESKVEIEFLMGFNCIKSSLNPFRCDCWIFRGSNHFFNFKKKNMENLHFKRG